MDIEGLEQDLEFSESGDDDECWTWRGVKLSSVLILSLDDWRCLLCLDAFIFCLVVYKKKRIWKKSRQRRQPHATECKKRLMRWSVSHQQDLFSHRSRNSGQRSVVRKWRCFFIQATKTAAEGETHIRKILMEAEEGHIVAVFLFFSRATSTARLGMWALALITAAYYSRTRESKLKPRASVLITVS